MSYEQSAVLQDAIDSTAQDEDGEVLGYEALVNEFWQFMLCLLEKKNLRALLKSQLTAIIYIAIAYVQITMDQEEMSESDPNEYVAEEEDVLSSSLSVRQVALHFVTVRKRSQLHVTSQQLNIMFIDPLKCYHFVIGTNVLVIHIL